MVRLTKDKQRVASLFQTAPGTTITSAVVNQRLACRRARGKSDCQTAIWDEMGSGGGQDRTWRAPHDPPVKPAACHRLFFQPRAGRIRKMEGSGARAAPGLTRRGFGLGVDLRARSDEEKATSPGRAQTPGKPFNPHPPAPAAASQAVALGHPPDLSRKGGPFPMGSPSSVPAVPEHLAGDYHLARTLGGGRLPDPPVPGERSSLPSADPARHLLCIVQRYICFLCLPLCRAHPVGSG